MPRLKAHPAEVEHAVQTLPGRIKELMVARNGEQAVWLLMAQHTLLCHHMCTQTWCHHVYTDMVCALRLLSGLHYVWFT